MPVPAGAVNM